MTAFSWLVVGAATLGVAFWGSFLLRMRRPGPRREFYERFPRRATAERVRDGGGLLITVVCLLGAVQSQDKVYSGTGLDWNWILPTLIIFLWIGVVSAFEYRARRAEEPTWEQWKGSALTAPPDG